MVWETPEEQDQLIAAEYAKTSSNTACDDRYEDWGCSFDDQGPEFWEDYYGGPDDSVIESYYESYVQNYEEEYYEEPLEHEEENFVRQTMDEEESEGTVSRTKEIVKWLSESKLARRFRNREGFFVPKGPHVRLKDGSIVDLIEWLLEEGIKGGAAVAGYSIIYSKPGSEYGEKLSFFKIIVDAPFLSLSKENEETGLDDDIPF